jgi:hypothetical protein
MVVAGAQGQATAALGTRGPPTEGPLVDVEPAEHGRALAPTVEASGQGQDDAGGPTLQILYFGAALTKVYAHGHGRRRDGP